MPPVTPYILPPNQRFNLIYDGDHKVLAKLNNLMVTRFKDGWYFAEVGCYKKELFKALGISMPTSAADNEAPAEDISEDEDDKSLTALIGDSPLDWLSRQTKEPLNYFREALFITSG